MQIKIGFARSTRELVISTENTEDGDGKSQDEIVRQLEEFLSQTDDHATTVLEGAKGSRYILVRSEVAYVEVGPETKHSVGFIR